VSSPDEGRRKAELEKRLRSQEVHEEFARHDSPERRARRLHNLARLGDVPPQRSAPSPAIRIGIPVLLAAGLLLLLWATTRPAELFASAPAILDPGLLRGPAEPAVEGPGEGALPVFPPGGDIQVVVHPAQDACAALIWIDANEARWVDEVLAPSVGRRWGLLSGGRERDLLEAGTTIDSASPEGPAALIVLLAPEPPGDPDLNALPEALRARWRAGADLDSALDECLDSGNVQGRVLHVDVRAPASSSTPRDG
jgi:hypothetical protein